MRTIWYVNTLFAYILFTHYIKCRCIHRCLFYVCCFTLNLTQLLHDTVPTTYTLINLFQIVLFYKHNITIITWVLIAPIVIFYFRFIGTGFCIWFGIFWNVANSMIDKLMNKLIVWTITETNNNTLFWKQSTNFMKMSTNEFQTCIRIFNHKNLLLKKNIFLFNDQETMVSIYIIQYYLSISITITIYSSLWKLKL